MKHQLRHDQRGAATLVVVMVLFFIISLVAAYTSRNLIFEQRTASNQMRSTQALETAEAGLEWALSMLNTGRIDTDCAASTSTADTSFRERYLQIDAAGYILPRPDPSGAQLAPVCVYNGSGTNPWSCKCPTTGTASPTAPSTTQAWPAFTVRFQRTLATQAPTNPSLPLQPGVVRVQVVGCTRLDATGVEPCLEFDGRGAFNEGRVQISANVALAGGPSSPPRVALMAQGNVNIGGAGISAYNSSAGSAGITIQAGGSINAGASPTLVSGAGAPGGTGTLLQNEALLASLAPAVAPSVYSVADRMFSSVFNTRPDTFRTQQAAVELACTGSPAVCTTEQVRSITRLNPWRPVWVNGSLHLNTTNDLGAATDPVVLVVNGDVQWVSGSNSTIYGLVYSRSATWATDGAGRIVGAAVAEGAVAGSGTTTFVHDPAVVRLLRWNSGSFVRVPGSWKDFYQ